MALTAFHLLPNPMQPSPRFSPRTVSLVCGAALIFGGRVAVFAADPGPPSSKPGPKEFFSDVAIDGHIFKPPQLPAPELSELKVPEGFKITKVAENLGNVRMLAIAPSGNIYFTRRDAGDVWMLKDEDGAKPKRVVSRSGLHGIAFHGRMVYLATPNEIFRAEVQDDGAFGPLEMIIHDLPDAGQHNTRTVQIGPDGRMYIGVGSTCNECAESSPESATILQASLDGKTRSVFAAGLRDPIGWAWHPQTGELWGMDHGIDWLGDEIPPEELNKIEKGKFYGWPYIYADNQLNPRLDPVGGLLKADWLESSTPMVLGYHAHAAPMQMSFYNGSQFPAEFAGDAFVSMRGSWNRKKPVGYEVVRVRFKDGQPLSIKPFVTGFVTPEGEKGRLCGNAISRNGSLLFSDDRNGVIYRVSHTGKAETAAPLAEIPAGVMEKQSAAGFGVPLALSRAETAHSGGKLVITSSAFETGKAIPDIFSEYEQGNSFPLSWSGAPEKTESLVLIMEDPDVKPPTTPYVHWVAWNIPAKVDSLRPGLHKQNRLQDPAGLRQGLNTAGGTGYKGPRPPEGDPPHHYHIQMFALDATLDLHPRATRDEVLAAMKGHVLASGELVGTFQRPASPAKP